MTLATVTEMRRRESAALTEGESASRPQLVVATTAHDVRVVAGDCERAGFSSVLGKPLTAADIARVLDCAIGACV